jgi:hypothetical protein
MSSQRISPNKARSSRSAWRIPPLHRSHSCVQNKLKRSSGHSYELTYTPFYTNTFQQLLRPVPPLILAARPKSAHRLVTPTIQIAKRISAWHATRPSAKFVFCRANPRHTSVSDPEIIISKHLDLPGTTTRKPASPYAAINRHLQNPNTCAGRPFPRIHSPQRPNLSSTPLPTARKYQKIPNEPNPISGHFFAPIRQANFPPPAAPKPATMESPLPPPSAEDCPIYVR